MSCLNNLSSPDALIYTAPITMHAINGETDNAAPTPQSVNKSAIDTISRLSVERLAIKNFNTKPSATPSMIISTLYKSGSNTV